MQLIGNIEDIPGQDNQEVIEPPISIDGEFWSDVINSRLERDGRHVLLKTRGGGTQIDRFTNVVSARHIQASISGQNKVFILFHGYSSGNSYVKLLDTTDNSVTTIHDEGTGDPALSQSEPIIAEVIGKFLYYFDPANDVARVYDIENDNNTNWYGHTSSPAGLASSPLDYASNMDTDGVFAPEKGEDVLVFFKNSDINKREEVSFIDGNPGSDDQDDPSFVEERKELESDVYYEFWLGNDCFIEVLEDDATWTAYGDSTPFGNIRYLRFKKGKTIRINHTSKIPANIAPEDIDITLYSLGDMSTFDSGPFESVVSELESSNGQITNMEVESKGGGSSINVLGGGESALTIQNSDDIVDLKFTAGKLDSEQYGFFQVIDDPQHEQPTVYRSYLVVDELDDGSYSVPGRPITVSVGIDEIFNAAGGNEKVNGIKLDLGAPATNVNRRLLFATRWQVSRDRCYIPSDEDYPNGRFLFHSDLGDDTYDSNDGFFIDKKSDEKLNVFLNTYIQSNAGITNLMVPTANKPPVTPDAVSSYRGAMILAGFTSNRPIPDIYTQDYKSGGNIHVTQSGTIVTDKQIAAQFEYADGTVSDYYQPSVDLYSDTTIRIHGLNALVAKIKLYVRDTVSGNNDLVREIQPSDPEFHGRQIKLDGNYSTIRTVSSVSTSNKRESVKLGSYITTATPGQEISIERESKIFDNSNIIDLFAEQLDKGQNTLRYRVVVITDRNIQYGYIQDSFSGGNTVFRTDFEIVMSDLSVSGRADMSKTDTGLYFRSEDRIYRVREGQVDGIVNLDRFPGFDGDRFKAQFYGKKSEVWFSGGGQDVLVWTPGSDRVNIFSYDDQIHHLYSDSKDMHLLAGNNTDGEYVWQKTDQDNEVNDRIWDQGTTSVVDKKVKSSLITQQLGSSKHYTKIINIVLVGEGFDGTVFVDLNRERSRGATGWAKSFSSDKSHGPRSIKMSGTPFVFKDRGVKPVIKIELDNQQADIDSAWLENIVLKVKHSKNTRNQNYIKGDSG